MSTDSILENISCGLLITERNGKIIYANHFILKLLGFDNEEITGLKFWSDLLSVGGKIYNETHFTPLLQMQGFVKEVNFDLLAKDKSKIPVVVYAQYADDERNKVNMLVCEMYQRKMYEKELLFEKKRAEDLVEKLTQKNKELDKFAYIVSHDLKAPLNNIIGLSDLIKSNLYDAHDEENLFLVENIIQSAEELRKFIGEVLFYYRGGFADTNAKEKISVTELINSVVGILDPMKKHEIVFYADFDELYIQKTALKQILMNLISNAIKYNKHESAKIIIRFWENSVSYYFSVQDNGTGIAEKDKQKIFSLFDNLGKRDRDGNLGTGIGLATVKRLTENHGGEISLISEAGQGTTFTFNFKK